MRSNLLAIALIALAASSAAETTINSGREQNHLIELYTSQGCSSCPPAERWLSQLKDTEQLWLDLVPVAWHVNYWDDLGWRDPFADQRWTERQRDLARRGVIRNPATPGFIIDGQEWRGFFSGEPLKLETGEAGVVLDATIAGTAITALAHGARADAVASFQAAILGVGSSTDVPRGENRGRTLHNDFVVIDATELTRNDAGNWTGSIGGPKAGFERYAFVVWALDENQVPLQAAGGWIADEK